MKAFRVKLSEGHCALASQVKNGYLTDNGKIQLYKGHEARRKAMQFGGIAEPYGKEFTVAPMQMAQFAYSEFSDELITLLHRERKYMHVNIDKRDDFYFGNVFAEILAKVGDEYPVSNEALSDLHVLSTLCTDYIYVQILGE